MRLTSYDVGSLPFNGDFQRFLEGARAYSSSSSSSNGSLEYFERKVVKGLIDKIRMGISIPNYPQFRDMNTMFLKSIDGVERVKDGYMESGILSVKTEKTQIPEVNAIKKNLREISEKTEKPFNIKISVTGPYTLSCFFTHRDSRIFKRLGKTLSQIVENNIFIGKHGGAKIVSIDEPTFGFLDDPLIDYGTDGRENLQKAWETIFRKAVSKGVQTCIHLHDTSDGLFWNVKAIEIVESHVNNFLYQSEETRKRLESMDKFLKASICITNFDSLILSNISQKNNVNEKIAEVWKSINSEKMDPTIFLEDVRLMKKRITRIVNKFGVERVPYAGPECGLKSFPTYKCALECLRRTAEAVKNSVQLS